MGLCFPGFAPKQPIAVAVTFPDGRVDYRVADEYSTGDVAFLLQYLLPGDPLGIYQVVAVQGDTRAYGSFSAVRARYEFLVVIPSDPKQPTAQGAGGTVFTVSFAGFPPNGPILFYVYVVDRGTARFVTSLTVTADGNGELLYHLTSSPSDPPGEYCLVLPKDAMKAEIARREVTPCFYPDQGFIITG